MELLLQRRCLCQLKGSTRGRNAWAVMRAAVVARRVLIPQSSSADFTAFCGPDHTMGNPGGQRSRLVADLRSPASLSLGTPVWHWCLLHIGSWTCGVARRKPEGLGAVVRGIDVITQTQNKVHTKGMTQESLTQAKRMSRLLIHMSSAALSPLRCDGATNCVEPCCKLC